MKKASMKRRRDELRPEYDLDEPEGRRSREVLPASYGGDKSGSSGTRRCACVPGQHFREPRSPLTARCGYEERQPDTKGNERQALSNTQTRAEDRGSRRGSWRVWVVRRARISLGS